MYVIYKDPNSTVNVRLVLSINYPIKKYRRHDTRSIRVGTYVGIRVGNSSANMSV